VADNGGMRWFRSDPVTLRRGVLGAACLLTLSSCAVSPDVVHGPDPLANASRISTVPPTLGAADCDPPSRTRPLRSATEVRAAASDGTSIWARFPGKPPFPSGEPIEVTWRVNGRHALSLVVVNSEGTDAPIDDVERDRSIRWRRPGDAWVSTIEFDRPGCWRINVARGAGRRGDVWVEVA
jgi:hypothetical protein